MYYKFSHSLNVLPPKLLDHVQYPANSYCVEAKYAQSFPELTFVGHRGPLGECAGDCDSNEDCFGELVCYQQSGATDADDSVPGCPGTGKF